MKTRVIGLGNELLRDDGVGIEAVREVRERLGPTEEIEYHESPVGGLRLLDDLLGCERVILIDAVVSGDLPVGTVAVWQWHPPEEAFVPYTEGRKKVAPQAQQCLSRRFHSTHDTDLASALGLARRLGLPVPNQVLLVGVVVRDVFEFGTGLDPQVARGRDEAAALVAEVLRRDTSLSHV